MTNIKMVDIKNTSTGLSLPIPESFGIVTKNFSDRRVRPSVWPSLFYRNHSNTPFSELPAEDRAIFNAYISRNIASNQDATSQAPLRASGTRASEIFRAARLELEDPQFNDKDISTKPSKYAVLSNERLCTKGIKTKDTPLDLKFEEQVPRGGYTSFLEKKNTNHKQSKLHIMHDGSARTEFDKKQHATTFFGASNPDESVIGPSLQSAKFEADLIFKSVKGGNVKPGIFVSYSMGFQPGRIVPALIQIKAAEENMELPHIPVIAFDGEGTNADQDTALFGQKDLASEYPSVNVIFDDPIQQKGNLYSWMHELSSPMKDQGELDMIAKHFHAPQGALPKSVALPGTLTVALSLDSSVKVYERYRGTEERSSKPMEVGDHSVNAMFGTHLGKKETARLLGVWNSFIGHDPNLN